MSDSLQKAWQIARLIYRSEPTHVLPPVATTDVDPADYELYVAGMKCDVQHRRGRTDDRFPAAHR
jgi:hypothetical protein